MTRSKKLFMNLGFIVLILGCFYFFGGYYFSKDTCIEDTLKALYIEDSQLVNEWENEHTSLLLFLNEDETLFSTVVLHKTAFLYHIDSTATNQTLNKTSSFYPYVNYSQDIGTCIYLYRNDPNIDKIYLTTQDGYQMIFEEWHNNFSGKIVDEDHDRFYLAKYQAYDQKNRLIEEFKH